MNNKKLLKEMKKIILENVGKDLISIYLMGSFMTKDVEKTSDIDIIAIIKDTFNFRKENQINKILNQKLKTGHIISFGTIGVSEFYGGRRKGSLTKHTGLHIFLNFFKNARLIYGKKFDISKLPIKPATLKTEMKYHCNTILLYGKKFRKVDKIGVDWTFRGFIKTIFYIANIELQITKKTKQKKSYTDIVNAFKENKEHVVHDSMKLRKKKSISNQEKQKWITKAEIYAREMKKLCK